MLKVGVGERVVLVVGLLGLVGVRGVGLLWRVGLVVGVLSALGWSAVRVEHAASRVCLLRRFYMKILLW